MSEDRPYWNMEVEPKFNTPEMRRIQDQKLVQRIKLLREKAPYFTQKFKELGIHEDKIKTFEEFRRIYPPFFKSDWRDFVEKYDGNIVAAMDDLLPINAYEDLNLKAQKLYQETDYLIVGNLWVHIFAAGQTLRGFENFMMDLIANQKMAHCLMENLMNVYMERVDRYAEAVGDYVQVIEVNDDLGTQFGPQLNPDLYRKMIKPYHRKLWNYVKEKTGCYLLLHSCGSVYDFIQDFIERL